MKLTSLDVGALRDLINTLENLASNKFSALASSPVDLLLESAIDLMLLLADEYKQGASFRKKNKGLKFLDQYSDPLGNPKQVKIHFESEIVWDPEAAMFIRQLANFFALLKRGNSFRRAFMALKEEAHWNIPPVSKEKTPSGGPTQNISSQAGAEKKSIKKIYSETIESDIEESERLDKVKYYRRRQKTR